MVNRLNANDQSSSGMGGGAHGREAKLEAEKGCGEAAFHHTHVVLAVRRHRLGRLCQRIGDHKDGSLR